VRLRSLAPANGAQVWVKLEYPNPTGSMKDRMALSMIEGAELEVIPAVEGKGRVTAQDIHNMIARAAELAREPGSYATDQFNNPYVTPGHRENLGREIWEQTSGRVTGFCQGLGTATSLIGVSQALKHHDREIRIAALEPAGSAAITGSSSGRSRCRDGPASCHRSSIRPVWTRCGRSTTARRSR
jgi:cysteine synthase